MLSSAFSQANVTTIIGRQSKTTVFPNPARSFIRIQHSYEGKEPIRLIIYNFLGKKQLEIVRPSTTIQLDLSEYKRGIYVFQFRDLQDRIIETGKFQVEK
jgi:hypothetical protein